MNRAKLATGLLAVASILSFISALIPLLQGGKVSLLFLGSGVVFLGVAIASAKRARTRGGDPPSPE